MDDLVIKSKNRLDLHQIFVRLQKCQLKMNSLKSTFGATCRKFLGFVKVPKLTKLN